MSTGMGATGMPRPHARAINESVSRRAERRDVALILLGTQGRPEDEAAIRTLWTAYPMFQPENTLLRVAHVLTVPLTAPLEVRMPEAEEVSARILRRAEMIARTAGIPVQTATLRGRTVAEALVDDARSRNATAIVVRLRSRERPGAHVLLSFTARTLLRDAHCPVLLLHLPHASGGIRPNERARVTHRLFALHGAGASGPSRRFS